MKKVFLILITIFITNTYSQNLNDTIKNKNLKVFAEFGLRSYEDGARILLRQGINAPVVDLFVKTSYKGFYIWGQTGADIGLSEEKNPSANFLQFTSGYLINASKFSFDINFSTFLGGIGSEYLRLNTKERLFIPNIYTKYSINSEKSMGLWVNYFESPLGNAIMARLDYMVKRDFGKIEFLLAYSGGPFETNLAINSGIRYTKKIAKINDELSLNINFNLYKNIYEGGDNTLVSDVFGGGIIVQFNNSY